MTNQQYLSDTNIVNQEDFLVQIVDTLECSPTMKQAFSNPVIESFPYAGPSMNGGNPQTWDNQYATPFVYLTPFNNLVSLRVEYADGTVR